MKTFRPNSAIACVFLAIALGTFTQQLGAQVLAGPVLNPTNGHHYYLLETNYWTNAEAQAVGMGGHLVTINDATENAWVLATFGNYGGVPRRLHIGLTDEGHEGQWVWTSGEPVTYMNWAPGEPNNGAGYSPHENYSFMYAPTEFWPQGSWNDILGSLSEQIFWAVAEMPPQVLAGPVLNPANGHHYYLLETNYWTNAEAQAIGMGGHLVTINDATENAWVLATFGNYGGVPRRLHIGLTDEGHEGQWVWTSGEPMTYLNWAPGEPNNGAGIFPHENYSFMYAPTESWPQGSWNDILGSLSEQIFWAVAEMPPRLTIRVSQVELCWPSLTNAVYQLQYTTNLTGNSWTPLGGQINGTGTRFCTNDAIVEGQPGRFYRIVTGP